MRSGLIAIAVSFITTINASADSVLAQAFGAFLMHAGLNDNQRRRVTVSLTQVEHALRSTEEILASSHEDLFKTVRTADDLERRREAEALIAEVRRLLQVAFTRFDLSRSDEDGARIARAVCTVAWTGVEEIRSTRLGGFGAVDPLLQSSLDPLVDELSRLLLHLARVFDEWPAAIEPSAPRPRGEDQPDR